MSRPELWEQLQSSDSFSYSLTRMLLMVCGTVCMIFFGVLPLTWPQQAVMGLVTVLIAVWLSRVSNSYLITLSLMVMSIFATFRYGWWRIGTVIAYFRDPTNHWGAVDAFFILVLVSAEAYAFVILVLGFMQTIWPLRRAPVPLPEDLSEWPDVDLLIPTYNEPLSVVRYTALAAMNIDWPADKLHVYILDDGKREEFRQFAEEAGVGYMTRSDNRHAKAGNINRALEKLTSPYVAIFDCDHVPTRSFLQMTMGWFDRDQNLAMMQTPHHFYSPDPFERNLSQFRNIPNEGELFYGIVQDGNDFWNATFFCGSCAILRRTALDEIGGIAVETVTEDAHTSLRMQMNGWNTAYINIPQAAGLATERLSGHVKQRIRWARGMIQILRTDNPLFCKGLKLSQRLCYFNAMTHFMYALPRLIFLTSPLIYLLFSHTNVPGYWAAIFAYALPHLTLSNLTNSRIQGQHRHSFWNEIYETVLSPYILLPTIMALINPRLGKFDVTAKGGVVKNTFFDARIAQPFIVLMIFNFLGLLMVIPRWFLLPGMSTFYDRGHPGTIIMNAIWTVFNLVTLSVATAVARESKQERQQVRIAAVRPVKVKVGETILGLGQTIDMSSGGMAVAMGESLQLVNGQSVKLVFPIYIGDAELPATLIGPGGRTLRFQFDNLTLIEEELLTMVLYSRADTWLGWGEAREPDRPLHSLYRILQLSLKGMAEVLSFITFGERRKKRAARQSRQLIPKVVPLVLLALLAGTSRMGAQTVASAFAPPVARPAAAPAVTKSDVPAKTAAASTPGAFKSQFTLKELGMGSFDMRGIDSTFNLPFALPQDQIVKTATLHLVYHFSPALLPQLSHMKVILNGAVVGVLQAPLATAAGNGILQQDITLPAEMLVRNNQLGFEFIGHYAMTCEDPANTVLWARVDPASTISFNGDLLPLADDLKFLPLPFFDAALSKQPVVSVVFPTTPSSKAMEAAGVAASYFGVLANSRPIRFTASVGKLPAGNIVLLSDSPSALPAEFNLANIGGPTLAIRTNPSDPYGKMLVITGADSGQLLVAAQALAMNWSGMQGATATVEDFVPPMRRVPDDAPRWARTDKKIELWDHTTAESMHTDGSAPIETFFRVPPDLYYADNVNTLLHVDYRYNPIPLGSDSSIQIQANHAYLGSLPLTPGKEATRATSANIALPTYDLRPFSSTLSFIFTFQALKSGGCRDTTPINMQGSILGSSYLDLRGIAHWATLPSLDLFANAGFPFTRFADLAETTVVLPDQPTPQELELYLTLMGHFGAQTGFPVLRLSVGTADDMRPGVDRDFLVIATARDNRGIAKFGAKLPVTFTDTGLKVLDTGGIFAPLHKAWWKIRQREEPVSGELGTTGLPDVILEGLESPFASGRSIVLIDLKSAASNEPFVTSFLKVSQSGDISGTVSVLHGEDFQSYRIGNSVYHLGYLPRWEAFSLWFTQVPWAVAIGSLAVSFLFAIWIRAWLRRRAMARLHVYHS